jgi:peptide/nickel transport system permease protein
LEAEEKNEVQAYIVRRLLLIIPTLLLVTILVFLTVHLIPGSVIDLMVAELSKQSEMGTQLTAEHLRHTLGLDMPIHVQYGRWLIDVLQGDLGNSLWTNRSVTAELAKRLPVSFELGLIALVTALSIALPIGAYSAIRQDTAGDYMGRTVAILALSLPSFWIGTIVIVYPSIWWQWTPAVQYVPFAENQVRNLVQFGLPGIIVGMALTGTTMRMTRTMMLEVLRQDYIRTAWAKGLTERVVIMRHALKNALIPVMSMIGLLIPILIGGEVIIETIFCLPGIGLLLIEAINTRDYPIISGINLVVAALVLVVNLAVDLTYAYLDPRIQYK